MTPIATVQVLNVARVDREPDYRFEIRVPGGPQVVFHRYATAQDVVSHLIEHGDLPELAASGGETAAAASEPAQGPWTEALQRRADAHTRPRGGA